MWRWDALDRRLAMQRIRYYALARRTNAKLSSVVALLFMLAILLTLSIFALFKVLVAETAASKMILAASVGFFITAITAGLLAISYRQYVAAVREEDRQLRVLEAPETNHSETLKIAEY